MASWISQSKRRESIDYNDQPRSSSSRHLPELQSSHSALSSQSHHLACLNSQDGRVNVVVRSSDDQVVVLDSYGRNIQQVLLNPDQNEKITCLKIGYGVEEGQILLAAGTSNQVTIYSATATSRWTHHSTLTCRSIVTALDIFKHRLLVGSGNSLQLYQLFQVGHSNTWRKLWTKPSPASIQQVHWNQTGEHFAAFAREDRRVIVWTTTKSNPIPVRTSVLPHYDAVQNIQWRRASDPQSQTDVLLTRARDGAERIWAPVIDQPDQLRLSASIDSFSFASGSSSSSSGIVFHLDAASSSTMLRSSISLLQRDLQIANLGIHNDSSISTSSSTDLLHTRIKRLQHLLSDTPDLFLHLVDNNSTIVIRALANIDRRPPTLLQAYTVLVLKLSQPLFQEDASIKDVSLIPFPTRTDQSVEATNGMLHFVDTQGGTMDVEICPALFFDGLEAGVKARNRELVRGHATQIIGLHKGRYGVTSVDQAGEAITWRPIRSHRKGQGSSSKTISSDGQESSSSTTTTTLSCVSKSHIPPATQCLYHDGQISIVRTDAGELQMDDLRSGKEVTLSGVADTPSILAVNATSSSDSHTVAALTRQAKVVEWQVQSSTTGPQSPTSEVQLDVSKGSTIVYASPPSTHFTTIDMDTTSKSATISQWQKTSSHSIDRLYQVEMGQVEPCFLASCSHTGLIAVVTAQGLDIYSLPSSPFEQSRQYSTQKGEEDGRGQIVALDWSDGELLAIGRTHHIEILCRTRSTPTSPGPLWTAIACFDLRAFTSSPLKDVKWTPTGELIVIESSHVHLLGPQLSTHTTLTDEVSKYQGPLPAYHPTALSQAIVSNRLAVLHRVINDLARAVEDAGLEERQILSASDVKPISLHELGRSTKTNGKRLRNGSLHASLFDDEDMNGIDGSHDGMDPTAVKKILDALGKVKLEGVDDDEHQQLAILLQSLLATVEQSQALDSAGYNYLLAIKRVFHPFASFGKPSQSRLSRTTLDHRYTVWAMHSTHRESLLTQVRQHSPIPNRIPWSVARSTNLFLWAPQSSLVSLAEQVARDEYHSGANERDPVLCSLFYYALGNQRLVLNLWKQSAWHPEHQKMITFLSKDFKDKRWTSASCKNAFALLSQRRFEFAASFFLLGDSLSDAINVCIKNLDDVQLAIAITRISEGTDDGPVLQNLITEKVIPLAIQNDDRYLLHWSHWMLNDKDSACQALLRPTSTSYQDTVAKAEDLTLSTLYSLIRHRLPSSSNLPSQEEEEKFLLHTQDTMDRIGCGVFAQGLRKDWTFAPSESQRITAAEVSGAEDGLAEPAVDDLLNMSSNTGQQRRSSKSTEKMQGQGVQPSQGPAEPDIDNLLNMSGKNRQPSQGPAEPDMNNLLNMGGKSRQPSQGPAEPKMDSLLNMGGGNGKGSSVTTSKQSPSQGPPEPGLDDLLKMGSKPTPAGSAVKKQPTSQSPAYDLLKMGTNTDSHATDAKDAAAEENKDVAKPEAKPKGIGSLMKSSAGKDTPSGASQGAQEFDMSNFGF
ncbi:unnamed protein product [Sympodiomycopsis kandeliae]